jgi:glycosyltransferase involved in cell wall biosynthesis
MKGYDALIFPTTYEGESHAGVIIEAYSVGLPVIAYAWSAIPEIVIHGKTGLLVSPKDVEGLTLAVKRLRDEPALQNRLSLGARRIFEEHFTDEASNTRFESILGCLGNPSVQNADVETIQLPDQMYF